MSKLITLSNLSRFLNNVKNYIDQALAGKANTDHAHDYAAPSHAHAQSDVTGLADALAGKASATHGHAQSDVTGLVEALAGKAPATHAHSEYATTGHTHADYAATGHTHADYALKSDLTTVYRYKGSVASMDALPAGASVGDVYNVEGDSGKNYAWTGSEWDSLGGSIQIEIATDDDVDGLF